MWNPPILPLLGAASLGCVVVACTPASPPPTPVVEQSSQVALHAPEEEHAAPTPADTPIASQTAAVAPDPVVAAAAPSAAEGALRRTQWRAVDAGGPFLEMTFAESLATFRLADGSSVSLAADLSGSHPACLGLRYCALTPTGDGQLVRYLFVELGGLLSHADCEGVDQHGDAWPLRHQELVATHGQQLVVQEATTVCWQTGQPPYRAVETASSTPSPPVLATPPQ